MNIYPHFLSSYLKFYYHTSPDGTSLLSISYQVTLQNPCAIHLVQKVSPNHVKTTKNPVLKNRHLYPFARVCSRMWCICWNQDIKIKFIGYIKKIVLESNEIYQSWKEGIRTLAYPPELFSKASEDHEYDALWVWGQVDDGWVL